MKISEAIKQKRTVRLYKQDKIPYKILEELIDCARMGSSARNSQPLEYIIVDDQIILNKILQYLNFGGFITEDKKAKKGNEPAALIIFLVKRGFEQYAQYDSGIAAQNITLAAFENNIGCCMLGSIDREKIRSILNIPDDYNLDLAVSLGYPAEHPIAEDLSDNPSYYRKDSVLHIPKRKLKDVLHRNGF